MNIPRQGWTTWSLIIGFWTLIGLLFTSQYYFELRSEAESFTISWEKLLSVQFAQWFLWIALSPLILWMGHLFPIERPRLRQGLIVHVPASVVVACLHIVFWDAFVLANWRNKNASIKNMSARCSRVADRRAVQSPCSFTRLDAVARPES